MESLILNLESIIGIVITFEIAKGGLMYGRVVCVQTRKGIHDIEPTTTIFTSIIKKFKKKLNR